MNNIKNTIIYFSFLFFAFSVNASSNVTLDQLDINLESRSSLQRGAKVFFDYCQGCHSLKYIRYSDLVKGLSLSETKEKSLDVVIKETLMHSSNKISENSPVLSSISNNAAKWFGKMPPDLSLIARYRGVDWLYTYMRSFYKDPSRPWGVNNLVFPDVGMPHVLLNLQGLQVLKEGHHAQNIDKMLDLIENGELSKNEYNALVKDLVTFLSYVGEPIQVERSNLGYKVLIYLLVLIIVLFFLKKEYWKDVK
ncbi:MAG TPA: cytochrome c1 [Candidatus Azoamicus sp. MARI]